MGDLFDEFMKELRRRQAEAAGGRAPDDADEKKPQGAGDSDDVTTGADADEPAADTDHGPTAADPEDPIPLRPPGSRDRARRPSGAGSTRPPRPPRPGRPARASGGPRDGAPSIRSRITTIAAIAIILFVV
ncbi:MAG TPA: hypothetical protein VFR93_04840, partial [Candidatus Limnocylindrales bacterium]|nr:hypothetical protein [Candidatus Limnocylindrales bacterium]